MTVNVIRKSKQITKLSFSIFSILFTLGCNQAYSVDMPRGIEYKLYTKDNKIEVGLSPGFILNQSYVNTVLFGLDISYFYNERFGISFDYLSGNNSDKAERTCIENFYIDPENEIAAACGTGGGNDQDVIDSNVARFGPAYVPIREIQYIAMLNSVWAPVYGKQLVFLSFTSYFDIYFETGLGLAGSKFYPKREILNNGNRSRAPAGEEDNPDTIGTRRASDYGIAGRPNPETKNNVLVNLGFGQKFHFLDSWHMKLFLRNMTLLGTESGFENFFTLNIGLGYRI